MDDLNKKALQQMAKEGFFKPTLVKVGGLVLFFGLMTGGPMLPARVQYLTLGAGFGLMALGGILKLIRKM